MAEEFSPIPLTPPAGVLKTESDRVVEGRWIDTQWMRFVSSRPQKMGGWVRQTTAISSGTLRQLHAWRDLQSVEYMAGGTYRKLYVYERDFVQHDITPLAASASLTNPFTTQVGRSIVSVAHFNHGRNAGDVVIYSGASAVGGLILNGTFEVVAANGSGGYTIDAGAPASSGATGGGTVSYQYEISIGVELGVYGLGYGVGPYGIGTYGTARSGSTIFIEPRIWSFDHFGKLLLAAYNGGSIYVWDPDKIPSFGRATRITQAPTDVRYMFVTEERFVMALCEGMRVDWCSQSDFNTWVPDQTNTANTRNLSEGTKLIAGKPLANHIACVWTDFALYIFQYTGSSSIFSTRLGGRNCGLVSPSCAVTVGNTAYWMGHTNFYLYNGAVQTIPNVDDIRDYVFDKLNTENAFLAWSEYLEKFNEIVWYYIAIGETQPSYYALLCLNDFSWAIGRMIRTAGASFSHGDTRPYWAGADGHIYLHEEGVDGDGAAVRASIKLGPSSLQGGAQIFNIDGINADFHGQSGDITATFTGWDRLRKATVDSETVTITEDDDLIDLRLEGRYISLELVTDVVGGYFRFGKPDVMVSSNGTRR
ncbi:hypothetical protein I6F35_33745 [Bradyrhizobium sp. BRP22]|uniref:hypothetical protein n=1 Tax=Bradyrhizobium sp. BRP22 TaxID=2793821 RepID=UPI001CD4B813|nr:hypothetical protein [Bradyrhizobium sp. BRP22]MCA1458100.1 hypothetical protein [Bradyrhizobium sp. BRP22]